MVQSKKTQLKDLSQDARGLFADWLESNTYTDEPLEDLLKEFIDDSDLVRYCTKHRLYEPVDQFNTPMYEGTGEDAEELDAEEWDWCDAAHAEFEAMLSNGGVK
jgi:hypothetical protein